MLSKIEKRRRRIKESLTVAQFLGGFTVAVLTFLITLEIPSGGKFFSESIDPNFHKNVLITITGISSTFLILSIRGMKRVVVVERFQNKFSNVSLGLYEAVIKIIKKSFSKKDL